MGCTLNLESAHILYTVIMIYFFNEKYGVLEKTKSSSERNYEKKKKHYVMFVSKKILKKIISLVEKC